MRTKMHSDRKIHTHTSTYAQVRATYTASHAAGSDASLLRSMPLISAPKAGVYRLISRPENSSVGILRLLLIKNAKLLNVCV